MTPKLSIKVRPFEGANWEVAAKAYYERLKQPRTDKAPQPSFHVGRKDDVSDGGSR
jgi:hypothetical protein